MKSNPLIRAWLESLTTGYIEYTRDWSDAEVPALRLTGRGGKRVFSEFEIAPRHAAARRYGYFVHEDGHLVFALPCDATAETQVYVAGDFNGWEKAVGDKAWRMHLADLDGEPMLLWKGPAEQFWTEPRSQFKFVTGEHQWLNVPENSPNRVQNKEGEVNHELDPDRTGRQFFQFHLKQPIDFSQTWKVTSVARGDDGVVLQPGDFFFSLSTQLPLGVTVRRGQTTFRLFAPRASEVRLFLAEKPEAGAPAEITTLERNADEPHVWEATLKGNLHGQFYWYQLNGARDDTEHFDRNFKVVDPYALAVVNHTGPGIVIDRAKIPDRSWDFATPQWQDLVVAEAHVRDLAAHAPVVMTAEERLGFTGLRKWVESPDFYLHRLGVNCVELQPVQEFDNRTREEYHWGYMPVNWFAPASAYALDPANASGIAEFQALVAAFHKRGIAVVLDVVYNHVGEPAHLLFTDKLYYFEQDAQGQLSNWSGCGNDLRAHAAMAKRLIIDSCRYLIETFGIDGFRFDLAELLGADVLCDIEAALKQVKSDVILIAEPWSYRGHIAGALRDSGWSSWNDGYRDFLRDYVRGGSTAEAFEYFIKGSPWYWAKWPAQTVNYTESHDDRSWIDVITENAHFNGYSPTSNDRRRTHLMAAVLFTSIGIPMIAAGQDFMRSKGGVNNTYQRGDLNALDYRRLFRFPGTHAYFADWIAFRRSEAGRLLRLWQRPTEGFFKVVHAADSTASAVVYNYDGSQGTERLLFAVNPTLSDLTIPLGDQLADLVHWRQVADHERFFSGHGVRQPVESELFLPALGCGLWISGR